MTEAWECSDCGVVAVDEDGCCVSCGRDCHVVKGRWHFVRQPAEDRIPQTCGSCLYWQKEPAGHLRPCTYVPSSDDAITEVLLPWAAVDAAGSRLLTRACFACNRWRPDES